MVCFLYIFNSSVLAILFKSLGISACKHLSAQILFSVYANFLLNR